MILHITPRKQWEAAQRQGEYRTASLRKEGFIHCSTIRQVLGPANNLFVGQHDLVLLGIAPEKVTAEIRYEDTHGVGQRFPHIYGPLNLEAVVHVFDFPPNEDGTFSLPRTLQSEVDA